MTLFEKSKIKDENTTKKCNDCIAEIPIEAKKCSHCGSSQEKKHGWIYFMQISVIAVFLMIVMGVIFSDDNNSTPQTQPVINYTTATGTPERTIENKVMQILGYKTNMSENRIIRIEIDTNELFIKYVADENITTNMTRGSMLSDITDLLKDLPIVLSSGINSIVLNPHLKLIDKYGNEKISSVLLITIKKNVWEKVNWGNFLRNDLQNITTTYWIHPVLKN